MPSFSYVAKTSHGETVTGILEAASEKTVVDALHQQGLMILGLKKAKSKLAQRGRIRLEDMAVFIRQMATLIDAGIPIVGGLDAVADQLENKSLRQAVLKLRDDVVGGTHFTNAVAKQSNIFSPLLVSMIRAGEASGHLSEVLDRLANYLEKTAALQHKVKSASTYPTILLLVTFCITSFLMLKVVPSFKSIFDSLGAALPLPTQILLAVSAFLQKMFIPVILAGVGGFFLFKKWLKSPQGRLRFDAFLLRVHIIGPLVRKIAIAKFARTLSTLVRSGVQILAAMEIVAESAGNRVVAEAVIKVKNSIREGENLANPLAATGVFPPLVVRMIAVGEQTGRLDDMLTKVADFYEEEVDSAVAGLTSALEPILMLVMGLVVGSIVLAIFLPIFKLTEVLGT